MKGRQLLPKKFDRKIPNAIEKAQTDLQMKAPAAWATDAMEKAVRSYAEKHSMTEAEKAAFETKVIQERQKLIEGEIDQNYINEFNCWITGTSQYNNPDYTPWGRRRLVGESIEAYLDQYVEKKSNFHLEMAKLRRTIPDDINTAWLYFSTIVLPVENGVKQKDFNQFVENNFLPLFARYWERFGVADNTPVIQATPKGTKPENAMDVDTPEVEPSMRHASNDQVCDSVPIDQREEQKKLNMEELDQLEERLVLYGKPQKTTREELEEAYQRVMLRKNDEMIALSVDVEAPDFTEDVIEEQIEKIRRDAEENVKTIEQRGRETGSVFTRFSSDFFEFVSLDSEVKNNELLIKEKKRCRDSLETIMKVTDTGVDAKALERLQKINEELKTLEAQLEAAGKKREASEKMILTFSNRGDEASETHGKEKDEKATIDHIRRLIHELNDTEKRKMTVFSNILASKGQLKVSEKAREDLLIELQSNTEALRELTKEGNISKMEEREKHGRIQRAIMTAIAKNTNKQNMALLTNSRDKLAAAELQLEMVEYIRNKLRSQSMGQFSGVNAEDFDFTMGQDIPQLKEFSDEDIEKLIEAHSELDLGVVDAIADIKKFASLIDIDAVLKDAGADKTIQQTKEDIQLLKQSIDKLEKQQIDDDIIRSGIQERKNAQRGYIMRAYAAYSSAVEKIRTDRDEDIGRTRQKFDERVEEAQRSNKEKIAEIRNMVNEAKKATTELITRGKEQKIDTSHADDAFNRIKHKALEMEEAIKREELDAIENYRKRQNEGIKDVTEEWDDKLKDLKKAYEKQSKEANQRLAFIEAQEASDINEMKNKYEQAKRGVIEKMNDLLQTKERYMNEFDEIKAEQESILEQRRLFKLQLGIYEESLEEHRKKTEESIAAKLKKEEEEKREAELMAIETQKKTKVTAAFTALAKKFEGFKGRMEHMTSMDVEGVNDLLLSNIKDAYNLIKHEIETGLDMTEEKNQRIKEAQADMMTKLDLYAVEVTRGIEDRKAKEAERVEREKERQKQLAKEKKEQDKERKEEANALARELKEEEKERKKEQRRREEKEEKETKERIAKEEEIKKEELKKRAEEQKKREKAEEAREKEFIAQEKEARKELEKATRRAEEAKNAMIKEKQAKEEKERKEEEREEKEEQKAREKQQANKEKRLADEKHKEELLKIHREKLEFLKKAKEEKEEKKRIAKEEKEKKERIAKEEKEEKDRVAKEEKDKKDRITKEVKEKTAIIVANAKAKREAEAKDRRETKALLAQQSREDRAVTLSQLEKSRTKDERNELIKVGLEAVGNEDERKRKREESDIREGEEEARILLEEPADIAEGHKMSERELQLVVVGKELAKFSSRKRTLEEENEEHEKFTKAELSTIKEFDDLEREENERKERERRAREAIEEGQRRAREAEEEEERKREKEEIDNLEEFDDEADEEERKRKELIELVKQLIDSDDESFDDEKTKKEKERNRQLHAFNKQWIEASLADLDKRQREEAERRKNLQNEKEKRERKEFEELQAAVTKSKESVNEMRNRWDREIPEKRKKKDPLEKVMKDWRKLRAATAQVQKEHNEYLEQLKIREAHSVALRAANAEELRTAREADRATKQMNKAEIDANQALALITTQQSLKDIKKIRKKDNPNPPNLTGSAVGPEDFSRLETLKKKKKKTEQ